MVGLYLFLDGYYNNRNWSFPLYFINVVILLSVLSYFIPEQYAIIKNNTAFLMGMDLCGILLKSSKVFSRVLLGNR